MARKRPTAAMIATCLVLSPALAGCAAPAGRAAASQSQPAAYTAELGEAHRRATLIARKIDDKMPLTAEDWAQTRTMIGSGDWRVRTRGLTLLPWFRDADHAAQAWQIALDHLADPEPVPRIYAAAAAGNLRPAEAVPHLKPLLQDPDPDVRAQVGKMLQEIEEATQ